MANLSSKNVLSVIVIIFLSLLISNVVLAQSSPPPQTPGSGTGSPPPQTPGPGTTGSGDEQVKAALKKFCGLVYELIPLTALTMVLTAAVVYAAGQFFGAETRARANVWATSMLTGALIGIIIVVIVPWLLHVAYPTADLNNACGTGPVVK